MYFFLQQRQSLEPAAHLTAGHNSIYQQADRLLVTEQTLVLPLVYTQSSYLVKPWVKELRGNLLGYGQFQKTVIEEH